MPVFQQNCTSQLKDGPLFTELKSQKQQYSLIADVCGTDPSCDDVGYDYPGSEERHHLKKKPTECPVGGGDTSNTCHIALSCPHFKLSIHREGEGVYEGWEGGPLKYN